MKHDIACALVLDGRGRVLLGLRASHKRAYAGCWDVFGGHVEVGESLDAALVRELQEEIGMTPQIVEKLAISEEENPDLNGANTYHFYAVLGWTGEIRNASDEHVEIGWFDLDAAMALTPFVPASREVVATYLRQAGSRTVARRSYQA